MVPSMLFDVYTYWFVGSSTMQTGPAPTAYGFPADGLPPVPRGNTFPVVESIVNAEIELVLFWGSSEDRFRTYSVLPLLSGKE